jgi:glutathione S-transferase
MAITSGDLFSPAGVVTTVALAAMGMRLMTSKKVKAACVADANGTNKHSIAVSSEHSFSEELLSAPIEKIYLFTFPQSPHVRNISPFALKVESFLRVHNVPHEVIGTFKFSPKGQMPYIRLNSKEDGPLIADSNFIIKFLSKKLGLDAADKNLLSIEQTAVAHAFTRMIEEHTSQIGFYYRYGLNMDQFCNAVIPSDWFSNKGTFHSWLMGKLFPIMMPLGFKKKMKFISFGRHSDDEKWTISCQDIQSVSDYLGKKKFMFGDVPTTLDCTLFGHLAQFLYIPIDFPQQKYIHENCVNVVEYVERFKQMYWKDWDAVEMSLRLD